MRYLRGKRKYCSADYDMAVLKDIDEQTRNTLVYNTDYELDNHSENDYDDYSSIR